MNAEASGKTIAEATVYLGRIQLIHEQKARSGKKHVSEIDYVRSDAAFKQKWQNSSDFRALRRKVSQEHGDQADPTQLRTLRSTEQDHNANQEFLKNYASLSDLYERARKSQLKRIGSQTVSQCCRFTMLILYCLVIALWNNQLQD